MDYGGQGTVEQQEWLKCHCEDYFHCPPVWEVEQILKGDIIREAIIVNNMVKTLEMFPSFQTPSPSPLLGKMLCFLTNFFSLLYPLFWVRRALLQT